MNKSNWNTRLENDPWRKDLCKRIDSLKQSGIKQVIIPKELSENILSRFLD